MTSLSPVGPADVVAEPVGLVGVSVEADDMAERVGVVGVAVEADDMVEPVEVAMEVDECRPKLDS